MTVLLMADRMNIDPAVYCEACKKAIDIHDPEKVLFMTEQAQACAADLEPSFYGEMASYAYLDHRFNAGWPGDKKREDWIIVEGMHEAIIDRDTFDLVQEKVKSRKRPDAWENFSLFAGLVKCGRCGSTMNIRRVNQKGNDRIYTCSRYNKYGKAHCTQHRSKYDPLYGIVPEQIRSCARKALAGEPEAAARRGPFHQFGNEALDT